MSKQRPYGTFEEAYALIIMEITPNKFNRFIEDLINTMINIDQSEYPSMYADMLFYRTYPRYVIDFWLCLCRMYGEMDVMEPAFSYISTRNTQLVIEYIKDLIYQIFPPDWDVSDRPIMTYNQIGF